MTLLIKGLVKNGAHNHLFKNEAHDFNNIKHTPCVRFFTLCSMYYICELKYILVVALSRVSAPRHIHLVSSSLRVRWPAASVRGRGSRKALGEPGNGSAGDGMMRKASLRPKEANNCNLLFKPLLWLYFISLCYSFVLYSHSI